jgi:hypothetical protein
MTRVRLDVVSSSMDLTRSIRLAHSAEVEVAAAVAEIEVTLGGGPLGLLVVFASTAYPREALAAELAARFPDVPIIGSSTAGELGPRGHRQRTLCAAAFPKDDFEAVTRSIQDLATVDVARAREEATTLRQRLDARSVTSRPDQRFALLFVDGHSRREEIVARGALAGLGYVPLVGASAANEHDAGETWVIAEGRAQTNVAAVALVRTTRPFQPFMSHHYHPDEERLVVTEADGERRILRELNGRPAAAEYARVLGLRAEQLDAGVFASSPVMVLIDGSYHVRSIRRANEDGSLSLYCAIEAGVVLRVAHGDATSAVAHLERTLSELRAEIGPPELVLAFACVLRGVPTGRGAEQLEALLTDHRVLGFRSFGEQYAGAHLNQTVTGLAFGRAPEVR